MIKLRKLFLYIIPVMLLCSCGAPISAPASTGTLAASPSAAVRPSSSAGSSPSDEATQKPSASDKIAAISPEKDGCTLIPGSVPDIAAADNKSFKAYKVYGYLAKDGCISDKDYWYTLDSAEQKDGKLCLTLTLNITFVDINNPYQDLKKKYSVSDKDILKMPLFKDCVINGGTLFASEDVLDDRRQYDSYKAWQDDNNGFANCPEEGYTFKLPASIPVSDNPDIILFDFSDKDSGGYSPVKIQDFEKYVLNPDNIRSYGDGKYLLDNLYFKFSGGEITAIYENKGDV